MSFISCVFKSKVDPNVYINQAHEFFFFLEGVGTHTKEPMGLLYKRIMNLFCHFSLFHMNEFLNEFFSTCYSKYI